ncbi:hypothetical protein EXIGLDRAFT_720436 [Exidia glandulosa HHB12029]|uniref:Uncharacterized protein n=1 Tax=Exidia glandulosa HHB12029 TaxID=1314781 RepID=A0A165NJ69_EXIGL|nr:hypothetical protein EXIGLDRAFT_720436 [Exidia glandulosa HHB12029]
MSDDYEPCAFDQVTFRGYISHLCCFPAQGSASFASTHTILRKGLAKVLQDAPFLTGWVNVASINPQWTTVTGPYDVDAVDDVLEFADLRGNFDYVAWREQRFSVADLLQSQQYAFPTPEVYPAPVIRARLTLMDGGATLAVWFHHAAIDGSGAARFWSAWAAACRGEALEGGLALTPRYTVPAGLKGTPSLHPGYDPHPEAGGRPPSVTTRLWFSDDRLKALKDKATQDAPTGGWVSSHDVLAALFWTKLAPIMGRPDDMGLAVIVNARARLDPPLPVSYIGNCVYAAIAPAPARSLSTAARAIRTAVSSVDSARIIDFAGLVTHAGTRMYEAHRRITLDGPLLVTSWAEMGIFALDWKDAFGGARAEHVLHPSFLRPGIVIVLPKRPGGLDVIFGQEQRFMDQILRDDDFMQYASWQSGYKPE